MRWIETCFRQLGTFGTMEKTCYAQAFGISPALVSLDQEHYISSYQAAGHDVENIRGKIRRDPEAPVIFGFLPLADWLPSILGRETYCDLEQESRSDPDPAVLRAVLQAIMAKRPICFTYTSMTSGRSERIISPHVLVSASGRLHVRGYDHGKNSHRDFVLTRMQDAVEDTSDSFRIVKDDDWRKHVVVEVTPAEGLDAVRREAIVRDFGMGDAEMRRIRVPRALAIYLRDQLGDRTARYEPPIHVREIDEDPADPESHDHPRG